MEQKGGVGMNLSEKLRACGDGDFSCIFGVVKAAVEKTMGERRGGLLLGLSELPSYVGAYHQVGSNFIVMNKGLLMDVLKTGDRKVINAYVFHILLHEYLHTLGHLDEKQTYMLSEAISEQVLGAKHPATLIARYGINHVIPEAGKLDFHPGMESQEEEEDAEEEGGSWGMDIVQDFEVDDLDYLG
jgi:hypothetical protein